MRTPVKFIFSVILFNCISICVFSQSRPLISDNAEIMKEANIEIDSSMKSGYLHEMAMKYNIKGEYVMNVTLFEKGKVLSVFVVKSDTGDVKQQNLVKDIVKQLEFNFKLPKGKTCKFERTFKFE